MRPRRHADILQQSLNLRHHLRILSRHIRPLLRIPRQIVQLQRLLRAIADRLPIPVPHRLRQRPRAHVARLRIPTLLLPIQRPPTHRFPGQHRRHRNAVSPRWCLCSRNLRRRRQKIREIPRRGIHLSRRHFPRPPHHHRHAQSAFPQRSLEAAQPAVDLEKRSLIVIVRRLHPSVIARAEHHRVLRQSILVQQRQNPPQLRIRHRRHRRECLLPLRPRLIAIRSIRRRMEQRMRQRRCRIQEKRPAPMLLHKLRHPFPNQRRAVGPFLPPDIGRHRLLLFPVPQILRPVIMRVGLMQITVKFIEPLPRRSPRRSRVPQPPFPESTRRIAGFLQHFRHRDVGVFKRHRLRIRPHRSMSQMLPRHQYAPRRRTHGPARVASRIARPFLRQPVRMRREDLLLPVASQPRRPQIVIHEPDDIRRASLPKSQRCRCGKQRASCNP